MRLLLADPTVSRASLWTSWEGRHTRLKFRNQKFHLPPSRPNNTSSIIHSTLFHRLKSDSISLASLTIKRRGKEMTFNKGEQAAGRGSLPINNAARSHLQIEQDVSERCDANWIIKSPPWSPRLSGGKCNVRDTAVTRCGKANNRPP